MAPVSGPAVSLLHEQRQLARDRMEGAARRVLATKDLDATVEEVAAGAKVIIRTFFRHYGTRDHMIATALRNRLHHYSDTLPAPRPDATRRSKAVGRAAPRVPPCERAARPGLLGDGGAGRHVER